MIKIPPKKKEKKPESQEGKRFLKCMREHSDVDHCTQQAADKYGSAIKAAMALGSFGIAMGLIISYLVQNILRQTIGDDLNMSIIALVTISIMTVAMAIFYSKMIR